MTSLNPSDRTGNTFTPTVHSAPSPALRPQDVRLPPGFAVCVVGASRGIGAEIAVSYAHAGAARITITGTRHSTAELAAVAARIRGISPAARVVLVTCDITVSDDVRALAEKIRRVRGRDDGGTAAADEAGTGEGESGSAEEEDAARLDVVVVNSGWSGPCVTRVTDADPADFRHAFDVNTLGTFHAAHHLIPLLLASEGGRGARAFVAVGTAAAWLYDGPIANTAYCVSKLAQARIVEMLALQYKEEGLFSCFVHPGAVDTDMAKKWAPEEFKKHLTDSPDLCGAMCVWLTKDVEKTRWLSGRYVSAAWDVDELLERRQLIDQPHMLKARLILQ